MLKLILVGSVFALTVADVEKELPARKNVAELFQSRQYSRRLGKSSSGDTSTSSGGSGKWSTSDSASSDSVDSDDGMCGCSDYLDDSSSSSSWSSGKKSSSTGTKTWSSGKKSSGSGSGKWSTDTTMSTTMASSSTAGPTLAASNNGTDGFCDCLCACNEGNSTVTVTSSTTSTDRRRNRRLGSGSGKWSTSGDGGCGSTTWSSGKKSSTSGKKSSTSGKKNSASKSSGKWSTDTYSTSSTTSEPCYTTTETQITCQCGNTSMNGTTEAPEEDSTSSTTMETPAPTEEGCAEDSDYMVLGIGWEYYLSSRDKAVVLSGRYDQVGTEFINENDESLVLWWESVGTDHVFVVGNQSNSLYQLSYKDLVSTWTDNDNPLTDSDDENEWDAGDDTAEYITGNITLYDCEGNNLGTDVVTLYNEEYNIDVSGCVQTQVDILKVVLIASVIGIIFG